MPLGKEVVVIARGAFTVTTRVALLLGSAMEVAVMVAVPVPEPGAE